ncbi:hypothetical protein IQ265_23225 [Nodosilinea sp. LEGE 06152]|uniref:hypothetical protein n=1 Tax=Nodosilinea sp. LEGE 06152 TaxID=2777966 RepID=UPI0018810339|nr:hypothetical protein [Nodosilinea sp. LEGE 06152]MBE9159724.1 hypothetical protein [Nodosilinea sp. LEGE 06152]
MTTGVRLKAKRTTGSGPPPELLFGELGYSDADQQFYIGRANPALPPSTFGASEAPLAPVAFSGAYADLTGIPTLTDYGPAIAALTTSDEAQNTAIDGLAADIALLDSSQTTQDISIAAIEDEQGAQNNEIASLITTTGNQAATLAALASVASSGSYADLSGKPALFSGAYADLSGKPALFSGAYADLSGKPTIPAGFTYDQPAEPIAPTVGQTWRERSNGGLIVGQWQWSGSLWLSDLEYDSGGVPEVANISASTVFRASLPFRCLLSRAVIRVGRGAVYNASNYINFQVRGVGPSSVVAIGPLFTGNTAEILATPSGSVFEVGINLESVFNPLVGGNTPLFIWVETSTFGSPSQLVRGTAVYSYRKIR